MSSTLSTKWKNALAQSGFTAGLTGEVRSRWMGRVQEWFTSIRQLAEAPPPEPEVFQNRIRGIERNILLYVRAVVLALLAYQLFWPGNFDSEVLPRHDAIVLLQSFFVVYVAASVGAAFVLRGMDDVSPIVLERVVYIMAILDAALLAILVMNTGGFDSILYWIFLGFIVRNAAVIPHADIQVFVNLLVCACYVVAGVLDVFLVQAESTAVNTIGLGSRIALAPPEPSDSAEPLVIRVLLLLFATFCCFGIQILIDRQRRTELESREFAAKQHQLQAAGRLAAEIAHQIKNPLGIINNAVWAVERRAAEHQPIHEQLAIIREEISKSDRIITELMGYARLAEGKMERVDVTEELEQALRTVLPPGAKFEIQIHRDYALGLPALAVQRGHFSEVFTNLFTNAREAMNGTGSIFIRVAHHRDLSVRISIRDTGPGIPANVRDRVFEPYFTTKEKGTGLGLAIVRHNVELYGGTVEIDSPPGQGTTFHINLPARALIRIRT